MTKVNHPMPAAPLLGVVSEDVRLHRGRLRFEQYGSHPIRRVLHGHALNAFAAPRAVG